MKKQDFDPCPFCKAVPINEIGIGLCCNPMTRDEWNNRPIEDALRQKITELESAQRWIPVEERLPDHENLVLVISYGRYKTAYYECDLWYDSSDEWTEGITHWCELPALPEV